jgi:hypothetical protein
MKRSQPKYAKARDLNEPQIIKALEAIGCEVEQLDKPVDLVVLCSDRITVRFIEVKNPDGLNVESDDQIEFFKIWPGGFARTEDEALRIVTDE